MPFPETLSNFLESLALQKEFILWNNKSITIDNATLFWKPWFEEGVVIVKDVLNPEGNFLSHEEFRNKFNNTTNYLHYFQFISAIPSDLKRRAPQAFIPAADLSLTSASVSLDKTSSDRAEARFKNITSCLIITAALFQVELKSGRKNSPKYLLTGLISFKTYIALPGITNSVNPSVVLKRELKLFRLADNDKRIYCSNADSIKHTFIDFTDVCKTLFTNYMVVQSLPRYRNNTREWKSCFLLSCN